MSATNSVYSNDTSITLDWADVSGANLYHLQVSVDKPDFSATLQQNDATLAASTKTFTDSGTNDRKRYWRWRYSTDAGSTWSEWQEVGSYWLNTAGSTDITLSSDTWALIDPDALTDIYTFDLFPLYKVTNEKMQRLTTRNRLGTLLSEYLTVKGRIEMDLSRNHYILINQFNALKRFNEEIKTFFLATYKSNKTDTVQNIWKVQFEKDPDMTMVAAGRPDLYEGRLSFTEV